MKRAGARGSRATSWQEERSHTAQQSASTSKKDSRSHAEGAANVVNYPVWTRFSSVIDAGCCRFG